jgi:cellulose synthase/poly-beta-1,6-N-acetylglucosamine synthase-like glycosyltransferase
MWFNLFEIFVAILMSIPLLVIAIELLISLFAKTETLRPVAFKGSYKIVIPAHNEGEIITKTLGDLIALSVSADSIIVVADNCTDKTADIARNLGCTVLERFDEECRGKGYALDYGIAYLRKQPHPGVVIILDADCQITAESLDLLASRSADNDRPVQALYLMRHSASASLKQRVAGFAWLVKNKIRPIAVNALGLPVTLTGTGMAFPWHVIADLDVAHGNIVEDMQLGIDCTLNGFPPIFSQQAVVYSDFPEQREAEKTQRTRWEHGHILTIIQQVPKLLKQALLKKDWRLLGLALDIGVPPLSLLVLLSFGSVVILTISGYLSESYRALFILLASGTFFTVMLMTIWWKSGREYLTLKELCSIPVYVLTKLSIYFTFFFKRQKSWVRTSRKSKK